MILNDAEIEAKLQEHINREWPPAMREKALRVGGVLLADLNAFFDTCSLLKADMVAKRDADVAEQQAMLAALQVEAAAAMAADSGGGMKVIDHMNTDPNATKHMRLGFLASVMTAALLAFCQLAFLAILLFALLAGYFMGVAISLCSGWFALGLGVAQNTFRESVLDALVTGSWWMALFGLFRR